MKTKILTFISTIAFVFASCSSTDNPVTSDEFIDYDVSTFFPEVGQVVQFTDYSPQAVSRVWTFSGGNPNSSKEKEVGVVFSMKGTYLCSIETSYSDGSKDSKNFKITVGNDLNLKGVFNFEDSDLAMESWKTWVANGSDAVKFSIDKTQGADGTSSCAKIEILNPNVEIQLFTKDNAKPINYIGITVFRVVKRSRLLIFGD